MRTTHTYVELDISPAAFEEIRAKLDAAGYGHAFHVEHGRLAIDMHGLGLVAEKPAEPETADIPQCRRHQLLKLARVHYYCEACEAEARDVPRAGQTAQCVWCGHPIASHVVTGGCIEPSAVTGGRCGCRS